MSDCPQQNDSEILFSAIFPVQRHFVKKNGRNIFRNRKTGQLFPGKSESLQAAENYLLDKFFRLKFKQQLQTIDCRINAQLIFYFPESVYFTKKKEISQKLPDISNLYQIVEDSLQTAKIISNDTIIESHDGSHRAPIKSNQYFLKIVLTKRSNPIPTAELDSLKV